MILQRILLPLVLVVRASLVRQNRGEVQLLPQLALSGLALGLRLRPRLHLRLPLQLLLIGVVGALRLHVLDHASETGSFSR